MAGDGPHLLHHDKGFDAYNNLQVRMSKAYKVNKRLTFMGALFLVVIPGIGLYYSYKLEGHQGFISLGTRRTEPVHEAEYVPRAFRK